MKIDRRIGILSVLLQCAAAGLAERTDISGQNPGEGVDCIYAEKI